jgi:membrane protein
MRNPFNVIVDRYDRVIEDARTRSRLFDHIWRAKQRYDRVLGGRLAAAIAYYGFFAVFALALVAYSILGYALGNNSELKGSVTHYLAANLPWLEVSQIEQSRGAVAVIGLLGLILTGVGWVEGLRSSQRLIWDLEEQPGNPVVRRLVDLGILVALGLLAALSLWIIGGIERQLLSLAPGQVVPGWVRHLLGFTGMLLNWLVNLVLAGALLAGVPRLRMSLRRLLGPALLVAIGFSLLTTIGQYIFAHTRENPAYRLASSVVGLLAFLYVFNQLLLFGSALAATSGFGRVMDLAAGPVPVDRTVEAGGEAGQDEIGGGGAGSGGRAG